MTISSKTLLHIGGAVALLSASYAMAQNGRPAPIAPDNAALSAQIKALEAELAATKKDVANLQSAQKTIAAQGFENKGELSALRKSFNKHTHWNDYTVNVGGKQKIAYSETSPASEFCKSNPNGGTEMSGWKDKKVCTLP